MANRLVNLVVRNVAAVERPANRRKWLVVKSALAKSATPKSENERRNMIDRAVRDRWGSQTDYQKAYLEDVFDGEAIVSMNGQTHAVEVSFKDGAVELGVPRPVSRDYVEKRQMEKTEHALTFDDAMMQRKMRGMYEALGERYGALMESLNSVHQGDGDDKMTAMKQAMMDFADSVRTGMPRMIASIMDDEDDDKMKKAGRKISADRMAKLKTLHKTLGEIIAEQEDMMEKQAPDATTLGKLANAMAAMFGKAAGADDATIAALEKAAGAEPEPIPDNVQALLTKSAADQAELKKANDELKARLDKAEADAKANAEAVKKAADEAAAFKAEHELRVIKTELAGYASMGVDPEKDAELFKSLTERLSPEQVARVREIFKSTTAVVAKGNERLFRETGHSGSQGGATSARAEVEQKISAIMAKSDKLDYATALDEVFKSADGADLYRRYREETNVRV